MGPRGGRGLLPLSSLPGYLNLLLLPASETRSSGDRPRLTVRAPHRLTTRRCFQCTEPSPAGGERPVAGQRRGFAPGHPVDRWWGQIPHAPRLRLQRRGPPRAGGPTGWADWPPFPLQGARPLSGKSESQALPGCSPLLTDTGS